MGSEYNHLSYCTKKCDCENLGNLVLKENRKNMLNTIVRKTSKNKRNFRESKTSFQITKETNNTCQIFSNQIIAYINDNKSDSKIENNASINHNNINTYRSTNAQSNFIYNKNNFNSLNNNDNNNSFNDNSINKNFNIHKNNVTVEKKEDDSSIYDDNKDSFIKMENIKEDEEKIFEKDSVIQFSKIEEKNEKSIDISKENQENVNLDNANIEELMNIIDNMNIENDGTIIEYDGEKCLYKGKLGDKKKINGKGKIYFKDGRIYEGMFIDGKLNGQGKYISSNGDIYKGNFINGNLLGKGTIIKIKENKSRIHSNNTKSSISQDKKDNNINDKIIYIGDIRDFKKEGHGIEKNNEYKYEGSFHNNKRNGKGILTYFNSEDKYEGDFKDDKITGNGYYLWENGHSYKGEFVDGKMNGKGLYKWPDGSQFEGEYKDNLRDGKGKFTWKNGICFEGYFSNGKPNGKGKMIYENESIDVEYKDKKFVGDLNQTLKNSKLSSLIINKKE